MSSIQRKLEKYLSSENYEQKAAQELSQKKASKTVYEWNTKSKVLRIAETIFSIVCFPVKIGRALHALGGLIMIPAWLFDRSKLAGLRSTIELNNGLLYKRITIKCDGRKIDVLLVTKKDSLKNGRWLIGSLGNGQCYETTVPSRFVSSSELVNLMGELNSNLIVFNYPGVGASPGLPSKRSAIKAYRSVLALLEDPHGLGAKEIIGYGHSIGGGIQGEALRKHTLKRNIKYVFVKSRTFDSTASVAKTIGKAAWILLNVLGWNIKTYEASKRLTVPEIVIQSRCTQDDAKNYLILNSHQEIVDDGVIPKEASLACRLIKKKHVENKVFIGVPEGHNDELSNIAFVADRIKEALGEDVLGDA